MWIKVRVSDSVGGMHMRRLNILMISPQYRPLVGGYERAAERLSICLAGKGHSITVVTERRNSSWPAHENFDGVEIKRLWCFYKPRLHTLTTLLSIAAFLLRHGRNFHIWHLHQYGPQAVVVIALSKLLRRRVVLKLTSSGQGGIGNAVRSLAFPKIAAYLLRKVDSVAALTRETLDEALKFGMHPSRVVVLGNGVDLHLYRPRGDAERKRLRDKLGIRADGLILFVGRLSAEKNPDGLLRAWELALAKLPPGWKLALVGDGPMSGEVAAQVAAKRLSSSVIPAGHQNNVDLWMGAADVHVLPSHHEGLSNTMLEAMATGLPIVSTRVSGSKEMLEETGAGFVVGLGREDDLANALVRLACDEALRERMGSAGRRVIENAFSLDYVASRYEQAYRDLIEGNELKEGQNVRHCWTAST